MCHQFKIKITQWQKGDSVLQKKFVFANPNGVKVIKNKIK